jgi:hypothetical protein
MADERYSNALRAAIHEYESLCRQRTEMDERIAQLAQTIGNLTRLCGITPTVVLGLTDACRLVLKAAEEPLTAAELRLKLEAMGYDTAKYSNPLGSIHVVLRRLCRSGEARFAPGKSDRPAYAWQRPARIIAVSRSSTLPPLYFLDDTHANSLIRDKKEE